MSVRCGLWFKLKSLASETTAQAAPESAIYLHRALVVVLYHAIGCYRIVGNCRERKFSQIVRKFDFHGENFCRENFRE